MNSRIFLIDGMALAYRAYFAFINNPLKNSRGENTGAVFGFINALLKIQEDEKPEYWVCVFDTPEPTFRHKKYSPYKATRDKMPDDMIPQLSDLKKLCTALRLLVIEMPGYEADDIIGTLAIQAAKQPLDAYIVSGDKDFMQLIGPGIRLYNPGKRDSGAEIIDESGVRSKFGVDPEQVTDVLALMGDASDNVPGVTGIGEKTAIKLIQEFHSLDGLYQNIDRLKGKQKENLLRDRELAYLSKELVTIMTDVPVDLQWNSWLRQSPDPALLIPLLQRLEFRSLVSRFQDNASSPVPSSIQTIRDYPHQYHLVETSEALEKLIPQLSSAPLLAVDTETTDIEAMRAEPVGISLCFQAGEAYYVPLNSRLPSDRILASLKPVLENPAIPKAGQNCKYDALVLRNRGIRLQGIVFDTMIAAHLLNPDRPVNLDQLALDYLQYRKIPTTDLIGDKKNAAAMKTAPVDKVAEYACEDADCVIRLYPVMKQGLADKNMTGLFQDIEIPLIDTLTDMEFSGVWIDAGFLKEMSDEYEKQLAELERKIIEEAGITFNVNSPQQLGEVLFERLQIQKHLANSRIRRTGKTGQFSTDIKSLEQFKGLPIVDAILAYRQLAKLKSTYIDGLPPLIHPQTGRIHTNFSQTVTATGRLSSSNPNFQNIPIRTEMGREIRKAFTPQKEGWRIVSADYSQIELRVLAHLSGDENMLEAFGRGVDFHAATASKIFHIPFSQVTPEMRRKAKEINFGIIYGMTAYGLAERIHISPSEASDFIKQYFSAFPRIKTYIDSTIQIGTELGYVSTLFGRRRYLPDLKNKNRTVRQFAERAAINTPVQGTAADIMKIAMNRIHRQLHTRQFRSRMVLQVHDEVVFETEPNELESLKSMIREEMEQAVQLRVQLQTDIRDGANWLESK